jgi:Ca2+/Na+ antiporter
MKESKRGEFILTLFFLAFFVILIGIGMTYSPNARRMPITVMIPAAVLCVVVLVKNANQKRRAQEQGEDKPVKNDIGEAAGAKLLSAENKRMFVMFGWMFLLVGMIWIVGFLVTIPVYTILFMRSLKETWRLSIIFGVVGFIVLYYLFAVGLSMELYPGLIYQIWAGYL